MSLWDILVPAEPGVVHNTIANPSFEYNNVNVYSQQTATTNGTTTGIKYWKAVNSANISRSNAWASQGAYSLKIASGATTNAGVEYNPRLSANSTNYTISLSNDSTYSASIPNAKSLTIAVMALDDIGMSLANGITDVQNYHFDINSYEPNTYAYPTIDAKRGHTAPIYSTPIVTNGQSIKIVITDSSTSTVDTAPRGWAIWYTYTDTSPVPDEKMYILASVVPNNNIASTTTVYLQKIALPQKMTLYTNGANPSYISGDFSGTNNISINGINTNFTNNDVGKSIYILSDNNQYQFVGKIYSVSGALSLNLDMDAQVKNLAHSQFYTISETNPQSFDNNTFGGVSSFVYNTATSIYTNSAIGLNTTAPYFGITNSAFGGFTKKHHLYLDWYLSSPNTTNPNSSYTDTGAKWAVYLINNTTSSSTLLGTLDATTATATSAKRMILRKKFLINRPSGDTSNMAIRVVYTGTTSDADLYIDGVQFVDAGMIWRSYDWYNTTASTYNTPLHFDDWDWDTVEFSYVDGDTPGAIWSDSMPTQSGTYTASFPYFTENGIWHGNPNEYSNGENAQGYASPKFRQQFQWKNEAKPVYGVSIPGLSQSSLLIQSTTTGFWTSLTTNNINVIIEPNSTGLGMPEIATTALEYGIIDGGFIQRQVARMRNMQFTITISAQSWKDLHANRRSLINLLKFDQLAQQGDRLIRYTGADTIIVTSVTYQGGLEYNGTSQNSSFTELLQIRFLSADPYFYALTSLSQNLQINSYNANDSSHILYKLGNSSEWYPLSRHYFNTNNTNDYASGETTFFDSNKSATLPFALGWLNSPSGNISTLIVGGNFERPFKNIAFFYVSGFAQNSDTYTTNSIYYNSNANGNNYTLTASTASPILTANIASAFYQNSIEGFLIYRSDSIFFGIVDSFTQTPLGSNTFTVNTTNNLVKIVTAGSNPFNASHVGRGLWTAGGVFIGIIATITATTTPVGATAATLLANSEVATGNYQLTFGGGTMSNGSNSRVILTANSLTNNVSGVNFYIIQPSKTIVNISPNNVYGKQLFQLSDNSAIYSIYQESPNSVIATGTFTSIIESGIINPSSSSYNGIVQTTQLGYSNHVYSRVMRFTMNDTGRITAIPIDYPFENLTLCDGTITVINGNTSVTGVNTTFSSQDTGLSLYYYLSNVKTFIGVIATVVSSTSVTLKVAFSGNSISSQLFYINGKSNLYNLLNYTSNYDLSINNTPINATTSSAYNAYFFAMQSNTQQSGNQYDNFYPNLLTRSLSSFSKENINSSVVYLDSVGNVGFVGIRLGSRSIGTISATLSAPSNLLITGSGTNFDRNFIGKSLFTTNGLYIGQIYAVLTSTTLLLFEPPPFAFSGFEFEVSLDANSIIVDNKTQRNTIYVSLNDSAVTPATWNTFVWAFINNPTPIVQVSAIKGSRSIGAYPQFFYQLGTDNSGTIINAKSDSPNILGADTRFSSTAINNYLITTDNVVIGQIKSVTDLYNITLYDNSGFVNNNTSTGTVLLASTALTSSTNVFVATDVNRRVYTNTSAYIGTISAYISATSVTLAAGALYALSAETFYLGTTFYIRPYKYITDSVGYQSVGGIILNGNDSIINTNFAVTKQIGNISNNTIFPASNAYASNTYPIAQTYLNNSSSVQGQIVNPFIFTDITQKNVFIQSGTSLIGKILRRSVGRLYNLISGSKSNINPAYTPFEPAINGVGNISSGAINANLVFGPGTLNATTLSNLSATITGTSTYFQTTDIGRSLYTANYQFIGVIIAVASTTSITVSNIQVSIIAGALYYFSGIAVVSSGANTLSSVSTSSTAITASGGFLATDVGRMLFTFKGQYIGTIGAYSSATAVTLVANALIAPPTPSTFGFSTSLYMYQFNLYANTLSNEFFAKSYYGIQSTSSYILGTTTAISLNYAPYGNIGSSYAAYAFVNSMWFYFGDITAFSYSLGTGTISVTLGGTAVTGSGTTFLSTDVGRVLFNSSGVIIGTIGAYTSATSVTLVTGALVAMTSDPFNISTISPSITIGSGTVFAIEANTPISLIPYVTVDTSANVNILGESNYKLGQELYGNDLTGNLGLSYVIGVGTITSSTSSTAISGVNTVFATADIGRTLYTSTGTIIGVINSVATSTSLTLVANGLAAITSSAFNISNSSTEGYIGTIAKIKSTYTVGTGTISVALGGTAVTGVSTTFAATDIGRVLYNSSGTTIGRIGAYTSATSVTLVAGALVVVSTAAFNISNNQITFTYMPYYAYNNAFVPTSWKSPSKNVTPVVSATNLNSIVYVLAKEFEGSQSSNFFADTIGYVNNISGIVGNQYTTATLNDTPSTIIPNINQSLFSGTQKYTTLTSSDTVTIGTIAGASNITTVINNGSATLVIDSNAYLLVGRSIYTSAGVYLGTVKYATSATNIIFETGASAAYGAAAYLVTAQSIKFGVYPGDVLRHADGRLIGQVKSVDIVNLKIYLTGNALVAISSAPVLIQRGIALGQGIGKISGTSFNSFTYFTTITGFSSGSVNLTNFSTLPLPYATTAFSTGTISINFNTTSITGGAFTSADIGKRAYVVENSVVSSLIGLINSYTSATQVSIDTPYNPPYNLATGTITVALSGTAVTGSGTTFVASDVGRVLSNSVGSIIGIIGAYTSATSVTLLTGALVALNADYFNISATYNLGAGTISVTLGGTAVTGVSTSFVATDVGRTLFSSSGAIIGKIGAYTSATSVTLSAGALVAMSTAVFNISVATSLTVSYALGNDMGSYGYYHKIRIFAEYQGNIVYLGYASASTSAVTQSPTSSAITIYTDDLQNYLGYQASLPLNNNGYNWYYLMEFDLPNADNKYYSMYEDSNISILQQNTNVITPSIPWSPGIGTISRVSYDGTSSTGFGEDAISIVTGNTSAGGTNIATRFLDQVYAGNLIYIYSGAFATLIGSNALTYNASSNNILIYTTGPNPFIASNVGQNIVNTSNVTIGTIASITTNTTAGSIAATLVGAPSGSGGSLSQIGAVNLIFSTDSSGNIAIAPGGSNPFSGTSYTGFNVYNSVNTLIGQIASVTTNTTVGQIAATLTSSTAFGPSPATYSTISANSFTFNVVSSSILIVTGGTNPFSGALYVSQRMYNYAGTIIGIISSTTTNTGAGQLAATFTSLASQDGSAWTQVSANAFTYSNTSANLVIRVVGNPFTTAMIGFPVYTTAGLLIGTIATVTANTAINTIAATLTINSVIDGTVFLQVSANTFTYNVANVNIIIVTAGNPFTSAHVGQKLYNNAGTLIGRIATVTANTTVSSIAATLAATSAISGTTTVGFKGTTVATTTGTFSVAAGGLYVTTGLLSSSNPSGPNEEVAYGIVTKVISNSSMAVKFNYWDSLLTANFVSGTYYWNYVVAPNETVINTSGDIAYVNNDWQSLGQQNGYVNTLASLKNGDIFAGGSFTAWSDKSKSSSKGIPTSYRSVYRIAKLVINSTPNNIAESYANPIVGTSYVNNGLGSDIQSIVDVSDINPINGYVGSGDRIMIGGSFTQTMNGEELLPSLGYVEGNTMSNSMRPVVNADIEPLTLNGGTPIAYNIAATNRMRHYNGIINSNILDGINGSNIAVLFDQPVIANTKMQYSSIRVRGNASVYPVITIANTTSNVLDLFSLIQTETGARILFNNSKLNIYPNEIITIDLRIGKRSVTSNTRFNLISYIHPLSNFVDWIFIGSNSAAGTTTQSTDDYHINVIGIHADYQLNASVSYTPRFWSFDANNLFYGTTKAGL